MLKNLFNRDIITLLLVVLGFLFYFSFGYDLSRGDFPKLITLYGVLFFVSYRILKINQDRFWLVAGIGVAFRFLFLTSLPNLSQDFYRFIWDGRLLIKGVSPYLFIPENLINSDFNTLGLKISQAEQLYHGMGQLNGSHYSNYPPINQLCFALATLFSGKSILGAVIVMRVLIIFADVGILFFGRKLLLKLNLNSNQIFWYFLNPFIIIELTGNLHFEGVMLFFLISSIYLVHQKKWIESAVLFGIAVSVKLIPLLFLPLFFKWFMTNFNKGLLKLFFYYLLVISTILLTFTPFLSLAFFNNFLETTVLWFQDFEFNASIYYIIRWIGFKVVGWNMITIIGKILSLIIFIFILIFTFFRENKSMQQLITTLLFGISVYYILSTTIHPWYIASPLLLSVFTKYKFPIVWSFVVILSYVAYGNDAFSENLWLVTLEYFIIFSFFIWELFKSKFYFRLNNT